MDGGVLLIFLTVFNFFYYFNLFIISSLEVQVNSVYKVPFFSTHKVPVRPYFKKEKLVKKLVALKKHLLLRSSRALYSILYLLLGKKISYFCFLVKIFLVQFSVFVFVLSSSLRLLVYQMNNKSPSITERFLEV